MADEILNFATKSVASYRHTAWISDVIRYVLKLLYSSRLLFSRQSAVGLPNKSADIYKVTGMAEERKEYDSVWVSSFFKVVYEFLRCNFEREKFRYYKKISKVTFFLFNDIFNC